jgi:nitrite reductase (NO-forming)
VLDPWHKEAGMTFEVRVGGAAATAKATAEGADTSQDGSAKLDVNATPPAAWQAYDPKLAPAPGGREHKLTLTATESVMEVAPGSSSSCGASEARSPGRRSAAGRVTCSPSPWSTTSATSSATRSISTPPRWPGTTRCAPINPGERLVHQFKAEHTGIYMYHCGTAPTLHHIGNGM